MKFLIVLLAMGLIACAASSQQSQHSTIVTLSLANDAAQRAVNQQGICVVDVPHCAPNRITTIDAIRQLDAAIREAEIYLQDNNWSAIAPCLAFAVKNLFDALLDEPSIGITQEIYDAMNLMSSQFGRCDELIIPREMQWR